MPYKEHVITRKYFSITDTVKMLEAKTGFKLNASALRFWEDELELLIKKGSKGRLYTLEDMDLFRIIIMLNMKYNLGLGAIKTLIRSRELRTRLVTFFLQENFEHKALKKDVT